MRMDDNADAKRILLASPPADSRRQLGHPLITWLSTIQQDLKQHHLTLLEAADLAQNRPLWRMMSMYGAMQSWVACQKRRRRLWLDDIDTVAVLWTFITFHLYEHRYIISVTGWHVGVRTHGQRGHRVDSGSGQCCVCQMWADSQHPSALSCAIGFRCRFCTVPHKFVMAAL